VIDRRQLIVALGAGAIAPRLAAQASRDPVAAILAPLGDARLGLAAFETGTGRRFFVDADRRVALCSTFKLPLAAAILHRVDQGRLKLDRPNRFDQADLLDYAPAVKAALPQGQLTVEQLCEAIVVLSDNSAANLLLPQIGGPLGFTRWLREIGDATTRLDRYEPQLNNVRGKEERDTTTPAAMIALMGTILDGPLLSAASRTKLMGWMVASKTGLARLRAGLPPSWRVGDKTGTSGEGWFNDVAIAFPPGRRPILIASYLDAPGAPAEAASAAHAEIGRLIGQLFA